MGYYHNFRLSLTLKIIALLFLIKLLHTNKIYSCSKSQKINNSNSNIINIDNNNNSSNDIIPVPENKIKVSLSVSHSSILSINIGTSGLILSDLISVFFTLFSSDESSRKSEEKINQYVSNTFDELVYLGIDKHNIFTEAPTTQKQKTSRSRNFLKMENLEQDLDTFNSSAEIKLSINDMSQKILIDKFLEVNKAIIKNKIFIFNFKPESIDSKTKGLKSLALATAQAEAERFSQNNKLLLRAQLDSKFLIDNKSSIFVYGTNAERQVFSNKDFYKPINILYEATYEIDGM